MLQGEHSAIRPTFIKLPFVTKIFVFCLFLSGRFTNVLLSLHYTNLGHFELGTSLSEQIIFKQKQIDFAARLHL